MYKGHNLVGVRERICLASSGKPKKMAYEFGLPPTCKIEISFTTGTKLWVKGLFSDWVNG